MLSSEDRETGIHNFCTSIEGPLSGSLPERRRGSGIAEAVEER